MREAVIEPDLHRRARRVSSGIRTSSLVVPAVTIVATLVLVGAGWHTAAALGVWVTSLSLVRAINAREGGWSYLSVFVFFSGLYFGLANAAALFFGPPSDTSMQALLIRSHLTDATLLGLVGVVVPGLVAFVAPRPRMRLGVAHRAGNPLSLLRTGLVFAALTWTVRVTGTPVQRLGFASTFLTDGVPIAVFLIRMAGLVKTRPTARWSIFVPAGALALVAVEVPYQLVNSILRSDAIWVVVAWFAPKIILEGRLPRRRLVVFGVLGLAAAIVFAPLGEVRSTVRGTAKLTVASDALIGASPREAGDGVVALLNRSSTITQLTLVSDLRDAGRTGPSLDPVALLIPRFILPGKAEVSVGEWLAEAYGRGSATPDGFSNAINLTPVGHFYLSYGWVGAFLGVALQAVLFRLLWGLTLGRGDRLNPADLAIAFVALRQAVFVGSSGASLVSQVSLVLVAVAVTQVRLVVRGTRRPPARQKISPRGPIGASQTR